jgi:hypothetical protein
LTVQNGRVFSTQNRRIIKVQRQMHGGLRMPWEVTIRRSDGSALGNVESVQQQIVTAVPEMKFYREASGPEKIAIARAQGVEFPEVILRHFASLPAKLGAVYQGDSFTVSLFGFEAEPLQMIHAAIRGDGNPVPVLAALCQPHGWLAIDDASREVIDLADTKTSGWEVQ